MPKPTFHNLPPDKRQRITDAAIDEFGAVPYVKATLDRIVEAAGISKGSMYQYFEGKADLYRWLLTEYLPARKLEAIGATAPAPGASVWEILEQAFLAGARLAAAEPGLTRLGLRFLRDYELDPGLTLIRQQHRAAADAWLRGLLGEAMQRGELRADLDVSTAVGVLAHALGEGALDLLADRVGTTLEGLFEDPTATHSLTDAVLLEVVGNITRLFRDGAGAP